MRTKQAFKNLVSSLLLELVVALSGIIVPRFFTAFYGSSVSGLVSSVSQFITYMSLVEAGIGAAGLVALYGPLAKKDNDSISAIVSAARQFYLRSGLIFVGLIALLIGVYPFFVNNEITDMSFIRMMMFILSLNGIVDYFFLGKYRLLLQADQKGYVIYNIQIVGTVVMTAVSLVLIHFEYSALLVKGVAALIYVLRSVFVALYVKLKYPDVNFKAKPDTASFSQRWSALLHQVVSLIVNNAPVVLLTLMVSGKALVEVNIFSTYNYVAYALFTLLNSIGNGIRASFGQVMANKEGDVLKKSYSTYEYLFFIIVFFCYVCMGVLLYPFIELYCVDFPDSSLYIGWSLVILFTLVSFLQTLRIPAQTIIVGAGHFKETQSRAIAEAVINLSISIALVRLLGIEGVLIGMLASFVYRAIDMVFYVEKYFIKGTAKKTLIRFLRNSVASAAVIFAGIKFVPMHADGWIQWMIYSVLFAFCAGVFLLAVNIIFEKSEFIACFERFKEMFFRKKVKED